MGEVVGLYTTILKRTRKKMGLTQKQLGVFLNYSSHWVWEAEHDENMAKGALMWLENLKGDKNWYEFIQFAKNYVEEYGD